MSAMIFLRLILRSVVFSVASQPFLSVLKEKNKTVTWLVVLKRQT